jgi:hypothetical protein
LLILGKATIRNQQVAGSIPAGGSKFSITYSLIYAPLERVGSNVGSNWAFGDVRKGAEQRVHRVGYGAFCLAVDVLVNILRKPNVRVPDDLRNDFQWHSLRTQERYARVA